ncbi:MAG: hypothetical protein ACOH19_05840 [Rhodoglobus sp.]
MSTFLGVAIGVIGLVAAQTSGTIGSQVSTAQLTFTISGLCFGYGTLLLLVGWIIAAAKHH